MANKLSEKEWKTLIDYWLNCDSKQIFYKKKLEAALLKYCFYISTGSSKQKCFTENFEV